MTAQSTPAAPGDTPARHRGTAGADGPSRRDFLARGGTIAAGLLAVPVLGSLSACSGSSADEPLSFWNFYGPGGAVAGQSQWFVDTVDTWNRQNREQIQLRYIPNPDYINGSTLSTAFAADKGPDIFLLSPGDFLRYYNGKVLAELTPYLQPGVRGDYVKGALETRTVNDKVYGLPMEIEPLAIYYRQDAFEKAHLSEGDIPKTWDQLLNVGAKLRTSQRFGLLFETIPGYYQNFTWYPFMWMGDGSPLDANGTSSTFRSKAVIDALQLWGTAVDQGIAPGSMLGTGGGDINSNLASGYTAMQQTGVWALADLASGANKNLPVGVFKLPVPAGGTYTTSLGGWAFVANARGRNPDAAARFCAWALASTSPDGIDRARRWNTVVKTNLPPRTSVVEAARHHGAFTGLFGQFADVIAVGGRGEPRYPPQVYKAVSDALQATQLGGQSGVQAAARGADVINSYIGGYHGAGIV